MDTFRCCNNSLISVTSFDPEEIIFIHCEFKDFTLKYSTEESCCVENEGTGEFTSKHQK